MAARQLRGQLKYRDGGTREFVVETENSLRSLLSGIRTLSDDVSAALTELVSLERAAAGGGAGQPGADDEEGDDSDDDEEEEEGHEKAKVNRTGAEPPAKRTKTLNV